jgi:hypothetical protein
MLGGHNNPPGNKFSPFRENILNVLQSTEYTDEELRAEIFKILDKKLEKYEVRTPKIILKQIH